MAAEGVERACERFSVRRKLFRQKREERVERRTDEGLVGGQRVIGEALTRHVTAVRQEYVAAFDRAPGIVGFADWLRDQPSAFES
jgi:hypothetical protein